MVQLTRFGKLRIHFRNTPYSDYRLQCNFKCSYCNQRGMKVKEVPFTKKNLQQTILIWKDLAKIEDRIYARINFNGEPLIDKWAKECIFYINKISNVDVCEIVTNNSVNPKGYLSQLNINKTSFSCSYHPEFITINKFIENVLLLKKAGCKVIVNLVGFPQIIKKIDKIISVFKKFNINIRIQAFQTAGFYYNSMKYPKDYSIKQLKTLRKFFYTKSEYEYMINLKKTKGLDCFAGVDMINVFLDGVVKRCITGDIGRIKNKKSTVKDLFIEKYSDLFNLYSINSTYSSYLMKLVNLCRRETTIKDLIFGKVTLGKMPYPCHEKNCPCNAHIMNLKEFREKYNLSDGFIDSYEIPSKSFV